MEIVSLMALLMTAYCGIFFLSDRNNQNSDFIEGRDCKYLLKVSETDTRRAMVLISLGLFIEFGVLGFVAKADYNPNQRHYF